MSCIVADVAPGLSKAEWQRLESVEGIVFDVQRYSLHDGPGLRTNVFLKGCPLRCAWCCNPESQSPQPELALFASRCFACADCVEVCEPGALQIVESELRWDAGRCDQCGRCAVVCASQAIRWLGRRVTAGEIIDEALHDAAFYVGSGGVTLTGGEPTAQPAFAEALLRLAKAQCLHTVIETCGHAPWAVFERLLPHLDLVLFDIKHMDPKRHREGTGVDNRLILQNARRIVDSGKDMVLRIPLIPGFSSTRRDLEDVSTFAREMGIEEIHLLPYHRLGQPKYGALARTYPWQRYDLLDETVVRELAGWLSTQGFRVVLAG